MVSIDKSYPNWLEMPNTVWKEVFSHLKHEDMRIARLACRKFDVLYEELNPIRTASHREAVVGLGISTCPHLLKNMRVHHTTRRVAHSLCSITDMPTHFLVVKERKKIEIYNGNDLKHPESRLLLTDNRGQNSTIRMLNARLTNKDKIEVFFQVHHVLYMASWKYGKETRGIKTVPFIDAKKDITSFHVSQNLLCGITQSCGFSFTFDEDGIKRDVQKQSFGPAHAYLGIFHPTNTVAFLNDRGSLAVMKIWNYAQNKVFCLEKPRNEYLFFGSGGFYASHLMVCWGYKHKSITCDYDLSHMDKEPDQDLKSQRTYIDRGKVYRGMKIVADKYVVRFEFQGEVVCDTIADRVRLWKILDKNSRVLRKIHLPRILGTFIFMNRDDNKVVVCDVATGTQDWIGEKRIDPIALVHSSKGPVLLAVNDRPMLYDR